MSQINDTATAIATVIDAVADSGVVYAYQPMPSTDWASFVDSFTVEIGGVRQVRAWTIQYLGETRVEKNIAMGSTKQRRDLRFVVRAHYGWNDPTSEEAFRVQLEAVCDALDAERSIGPCYDHDPVDVDIPANGAGVVLGDVLCHFAEITVVCQIEQTLATA